MPIRFHCHRCNQLLSIASRKAGAEIGCPKCGLPQTVPTEEAAAAALAMTRSEGPSASAPALEDVVVYDEDEPMAIDTPRRRHAEPTPSGAPSQASAEPTAEAPPAALPEAPPAAPPAAPSAPAEQSDSAPAPPPAGEPVPRGMVLFRRQTLYAQAVLFVVLAAVAFASGYFFGRGDANYEVKVAAQEAAKDPVPLDGKIVYDPGTGRRVGDAEAVVIALPESEEPEESLSIDGIRPQDPPPPDSHKSVRLIEELGGAYTRANPSGSFTLVVPQPGRYFLLLISRHTARPQGREIDQIDLHEMQAYFARAQNLVSRYKYRWSLEEIDFDAGPIEHDFGADGK